jgi:hypothetical protein
MNLVFGIFVLLCAIGLFAYESVTGKVPLRMIGLNISSAWFLVLLALYNFARWYSAVAAKREAQAMRYVREARVRQAQRRERPEPDPTFDFSDRPAAPLHPPHDAPPSEN